MWRCECGGRWCGCGGPGDIKRVVYGGVADLRREGTRSTRIMLQPPRGPWGLAPPGGTQATLQAASTPRGGEAGPRIARLILCRAQTPVRATCKGGNRKGPDTYLCAFGSRATLNARALAEGLRSRNTYGSTSMELFRPHCKVRIIPGRRWKSMPSLEQVRWAALRPPGMLIPL